MHWKRRRRKWPFVVALGLLFALTLAAPWSWQRFRTAPREAARPITAAVAEAKPKPRAARPPKLPWIEPGRKDAPQSVEPVVAADDYVVIDEPLTAPVVDEGSSLKPAAEPPAPESEQSASPRLSQRPARRSVLVRNVPAPAEPPRPAFNLESLLEVRDALVAMVERAQQQSTVQLQPASQPALNAPMPTLAGPDGPSHNPLRVIVESDSDRLAMIPQESDFLPHPHLAERPELAPTPVDDKPVLRYRPTALVAQLEALTTVDPAAAWAGAVLARVDELTNEPLASRPSWDGLIGELQTLAQQGFNESLTVADPADQSAWLRASRALDRRLPVWSLLADPRFARDLASHPEPSLSSYGLIQALHEVANLTADSEAGASWRAYLRLDDLAALTSVGGQDHIDSRRAAAREVLMRMSDPWLSREQQMYLAQPPLVTLAEELKPWATGEVSIEGLAGLLERFEQTGSRRDAAAIAELRLRMKWSADDRLIALAEDLNRNYRNANFRVALSSDILNRMVPEQAPRVAPVNSRIAGADVKGRSQTNTEIKVRLLPDPTVWRFGLEAYGKINSQTYSETWPARVRNSSHMQYEARKLVMLNRYGVHVFPAESRAHGTTDLVGVDSGLRLVPIVGAIVEQAAREQHRQSRSAAVAQVKSKISREARERMDEEAGAKLRNLEERFRTNILEPMERFAIVAEPVDMNTTDERATLRVRLAGEQQLAAHTPRPSAPSDSLASLQLHESALNNAMRGLDLDGRRMTVGELHAQLAAKVRRANQEPPEDLPARAKVQFAAHDAIRVSCQGDRVELILNIVELRHGRDSIRNVAVHAFFRPEVDGLEVKLVRDGTLQFDGAHLRTGPRLVLHSVFGKLLRKEQEVPVLAARLADDPRFDGLMVTQLVIDDGWVALSLGPATPDRTAWRTRASQTR